MASKFAKNQLVSEQGLSAERDQGICSELPQLLVLRSRLPAPRNLL